jgi:ribonuclease III
VDAALGQTQQRKEHEQGKTKHGLRTIEKVYGDIFEAYVGAIIRSDHENGVQIVADWLKALWGRLIEDELRKMIETRDKNAQYSRIVASIPKRAFSEDPAAVGDVPPKASAEDDTTSNPNVNAKDRLARALLFPGVKLQYEDMPSNKTLKDKEGHTLFAIGVYYQTGWGDSERLAIGKARKKSEAGIRAAEYALQNKKILKKYGDKKEAFLKARDEREAGDSVGT